MTILCARDSACRGGDRPPRQAIEGAMLCEVCEDRVRENLHMIGNLWEDLEATMFTKAASIGGNGGGSDPAKPPASSSAMELHAEVQGLFWYWSKIVWDERSTRPPEPWTVPTLAEWLSKYHATWIAAHPDLAPDVGGESFRLRKAIEATVEQNRIARVATGETCPVEGCAGQLEARYKTREGRMPFFVCTADRDHKSSPVAWQRAQLDNPPAHTTET